MERLPSRKGGYSLDLLEQQKLRYIVVARRLKPLQRLVKNDLLWTPSAVPGTDVAEVWHQEVHWAQPRRQALAGLSGLFVSSAGDQPARERAAH